MMLLEYAVQPHFFSDEIVEYLIKQGIDPNKMLDNQCFLLHIAVLKGNLKSAKALIDHGADISVKNQGFEALENMKLSNGINGRTALHFAIQLYNKYKEAVELHREDKAIFDEKVEAGGLSKIDGDYQAKLNEIEEIEKNERETFKIQWDELEKEADRKKRPELRKTLKTVQKNMNKKFEQQKNDAENSRKLEVNKYKQLENEAKSYDKYLAKTDEAIEFVKFLVSKDADLTAQDEYRVTPLDLAKKRSDNQELVKFLENASVLQEKKKDNPINKQQPSNIQIGLCPRKLAVISVAAISCALALYFLAPLIIGSAAGVGTQLALGAVGAVVGAGIGILTNVAIDQCYVNSATRQAD